MRTTCGPKRVAVHTDNASPFTTRIINDCILPDHRRLRTVTIQRESTVRAVIFQYIDEGGTQLQEFILYAPVDVDLAQPYIDELLGQANEGILSIGDAEFAYKLSKYGVQHSMRAPLMAAALRVAPIEKAEVVAAAISSLCGWPAGETQMQQTRLRLA